jgi:hypothetical protein
MNDHLYQEKCSMLANTEHGCDSCNILRLHNVATAPKVAKKLEVMYCHFTFQNQAPLKCSEVIIFYYFVISVNLSLHVITLITFAKYYTKHFS